MLIFSECAINTLLLQQNLIQNKQKTLKEKKEQLQETDEKLILLKQKCQELLQLFSQLGRYLTYLPNMIGEQLEILKNTMSFDQREMFD